MATWKKVIVSGSVAELSASLYRSSGQSPQQITTDAATTVLSGSFSGSFAGNGSGLTNIPYSSITDAPQGGGSGTLIASGSFTGSFTLTNNGLSNFKIVSGSTPVTLLDARNTGLVSAGNALSGSFTAGGATGSRSFLSGITGINYTATSGVNVTATSVKGWNDTADGNWNTSLLASLITADTPISDILYFLLRPYAQSFQAGGPNPGVFNNTTATLNQAYTQANPIQYIGAARVPNGTTPESTINTYTTNGWQLVGGLYLNVINQISAANRLNSTIFTNYYSVSSNRTGTTVPSSNVNAFNLGLTNAGSVTDFYLSASISYKSRTGPGFTSNWSSASQFEVSVTDITSAPNANGLYFNRVPDNLNQFPYQDGYFAFAPLGQHFKIKANANGTTPTTDDTIGYYEVSASIYIVSSSAAGVRSPLNIGATGAEIRNIAFYLPAGYTTYVPPFNSYTPAFTTNTLTLIPGTIRSSSLSGAPYYYSASYAVSESITNAFSPLYSNSANIYTFGSGVSVSNIVGSNIVTLSGQPSNFGIDVNDGTLNTAAVGKIFSSDGLTARIDADVPTHNDIIRLNYKVDFNARNASNQSNLVIGATAPQQPIITVNGPTIAKPNTSTPLADYTRAAQVNGDVPVGTLHNVMAWRKLIQGEANRTTANLDATTQTRTDLLLDEAYRLQISNDTLAFNLGPAAWPTTFGLDTLGALDLQVKSGPSNGWLVRPGSTNYGYWISDPASGQAYKYYITYFNTAGTPSGNKQSITISLGNSGITQPWATLGTDGIACAVLLENLKYGNSPYNDAVLIDTGTTSSNLWATNLAGNGIVTANTAGLNPFNQQIRLMTSIDGAWTANGNASIICLTAAPYYQVVNSAVSGQQRIAVIIRMKGDFNPPSSVTLTTA